MRPDQREYILKMLFSATVENLDELRERGIEVPSDVYLNLGLLQGNIAGIMDSIAINHQNEVARLRKRLKAKDAGEEHPSVEETNEDAEEEEHEEEETEEEEFTRMEQVSAKYRDKDRKPGEERSPLARHRNRTRNRNVVNIHDE